MRAIVVPATHPLLHFDGAIAAWKNLLFAGSAAYFSSKMLRRRRVLHR
jgi:hypothetical protein